MFDSTMKHPLPVFVLRRDGDTTNGGVTASGRYRWYQLCPEPITDPMVLAAAEERGCCLLLLERRDKDGWPPIARPMTENTVAENRFGRREVSRAGAAGGNFVYSSDSRFREEVWPSPISVHDRFEEG